MPRKRLTKAIVNERLADRGIVMLDPDKEGSTDTLISEASVRSLYRHYREVMDL